jgi:glycosyltransferase involved in cell wall biosynthesis
VLPSCNELESFGMVSAEAIKCCCPVIASNRPGIRVPVMISQYGSLFDESNFDDLVNKIKTVASNKIIFDNKINNLFKLEDFFENYKKIIWQK